LRITQLAQKKHNEQLAVELRVARKAAKVAVEQAKATEKVAAA